MHDHSDTHLHQLIAIMKQRRPVLEAESTTHHHPHSVKQMQTLHAIQRLADGVPDDGMVAISKQRKVLNLARELKDKNPDDIYDEPKVDEDPKIDEEPVVDEEPKTEEPKEPTTREFIQKLENIDLFNGQIFLKEELLARVADHALLTRYPNTVKMVMEELELITTVPMTAIDELQPERLSAPKLSSDAPPSYPSL